MRGKSVQAERREMQRTQRFDFKNTSQALEKGHKDDTNSDNLSSNEQVEERKMAQSREDSAEMDSNESEMEKIEREAGKNLPTNTEGFYKIVEYSQLEQDEDDIKEPESSNFDFRFPSNGKLDQASRVRQIEFEDQSQQDSSSNLHMAKIQFKNRSQSQNSQATNESFSSPESQISPVDQQRLQMQEPRRLNFKHVKKSSVGHSRKTSDGQKRSSNQTETLQNKVALILPFKEEQETELMEYQCQSSDSQGLEQEDASNQDSLDSDERAEQLRRQDMLEYEIMRLEQLNLEIAQRLKEPQTTDESEDEKEEFNLLEDSASLIQVRPISNLDEDQNQNQTQSPGKNNPFYTFERIENVDANNQDERSDKSPADRSSFQQSVKSRQSRKLYVIEEEQSNIGGQQSTYRSRHSQQRAQKSDQSDRTYPPHEKHAQRNSDTYAVKNQDGKLHELSMGDMTRTQKFDVQMRQSLGSGNLAASLKSSMNSPNRNLDNSSPDFKKAITSSKREQQDDNLLETATYNHARNTRVKSEIIRKEQTQPNDKGSFERSQDRQNDISKDLIPKYLRDTTQTSDMAMKIQRLTPSGPFEMISDEDLMNSNFGRISKILPGPEHLLTDENDRDTPVSDQYPNLDSSSNERKLIMQLLSENTQLKQIIAQKDKQLKVQAKKLAKQFKPDLREQSTQTNGPRSKAYYESIPAKVDTGIMKRAPSEENNASFALKPYVIDSSKRSSDAEKNKRANTPTKKRKSFSTSTPKNKKGQKQDFIASPQKLQMMAQVNSQNPNEDVKSLRVQLVSLKNQLTSQETDNMQLQEKIAYFESHAARMEKKLAKLDAKLKNKKSQNQELQSSIEELGQRIESLMADNSELRAQLQSQDPSFSLSFHNQKLQIEQQKNFQLNQKIQQMEQEARKHEKRLNKLRRELAQVLFDKQEISNRLDKQFKENQRIVSKQPDLFDYGTQTDANLWKEFIKNVAKDQKISRVSTEPQSPKVLSPKAQSTKTNLDNKSVQVTVTSSHPVHQDHMSDAGLGEQGSNAEQEFIKLLINRANDYEIQYQRIEQEIKEYKRLMHEVGQQQQATASHFRGGSHVSNMSHIVGVHVPTNPNTSQVVDSQYTSHANITPINATPHALTVNGPSVDQRGPFVEHLIEPQFAHYKKKARKLERRNQKLQIEKELSAKQIQDLQIRIQEISEKYRDMKQKLYLRLQEKSAKLNDLRHQLTQARAMPQILPVPQMIDVERLKTAHPVDIQDRRQRQNRQSREGQDRSRRITPNRRNEDEFNQVLIGTLNEDQMNDFIKVNKYQNTQTLVSERSSELGRFNQNPSVIRGNTFCNDRVGTSIFDEPTDQAKQNFYEARPNQSMVSNTGEIYSIISGIVDQKFAERQQYEQQLVAQAQMIAAYQDSKVKSGNFDLKQRRADLTQEQAKVSDTKLKKTLRNDDPMNLVVKQSHNSFQRPLKRPEEHSDQKMGKQNRDRREKQIDEVPTQQFQRFFERKSPVKVEFLSKAANSKITSLSPQRRTNSGVSRSSGKTSAKKRNRSANSQVSKDDVMPCYKSQFPHHPNQQVVHQPRQVVSDMLSYYFQQTSPKVSSGQNLSAMEAPRTRNTIAPSTQITRNVQTHTSAESNNNALRHGKITQMLMNGHFRNYVEPGQTR